MSLDHKKRKRGRKAKDPIDANIENSRKMVLRGIPHLLSTAMSVSGLQTKFNFSNDEITREVIARELQITRDRELIEIREVPVTDVASQIGGCPVATRLALPQFAVSRSITNCIDQLGFYQTTTPDKKATELNSTLFTPESLIVLSKACEQMVVELSVRAFLDASDGASPRLLSSQHLAEGARAAWKSREREYSAQGCFDFLGDVFDRDGEDEIVDPFDTIHKFHRRM